MAQQQRRQKSRNIEYQNDDISPVYVENVQGVPTSRGSLQMMFFSDYITHHKDGLSVALQKVEGPVADPLPDQPSRAVSVEIGDDPYGLMRGDVRVVRRIEANIVMTLPALKALVPWLNLQIQALEATSARPQEMQ